MDNFLFKVKKKLKTFDAKNYPKFLDSRKVGVGISLKKQGSVGACAKVYLGAETFESALF